MTKGRSPNYPSLALADAIEKLRLVYEGIHTYPAPKEVVAENLGYSSMSGRVLTLIGTMRRYGLLRSEGGQLRITDIAVAILELPDGSPERQNALREAAFAPDLFSALHSDFPDKLPNDSTLRHYLIKKGFMPRAADEIVLVYRANLELVEDDGEGYNQPMQTQSTSLNTTTNTSRTDSIQSAAMGHASPKDGRKELKFNISRETEALVIFIGPVTQEAIEKLAALLELQKDTFPMKAELQQEAVKDNGQEE